MDSEDILQDALEFLGGSPVIDDSVIRYGPLELTVAPKEGKANTLLADHLFSPALFLAERIDQGLLDVKGKTVLELGAGCALPSLLLTASANPPSLVVVTDYPDEIILGNLKLNIKRNRGLVVPGCTVECCGYAWGSDPSELRNLCSAQGCNTVDKSGFDIMILSDLLHFFESHDVLVQSIQFMLSKSKSSRIYVGAGKYTREAVCENFLSKVADVGLMMEEIVNDEREWRGTLNVSNLSPEDLQVRKANCRFWIGQWAS
ncbi:hypothetical protein CPB83DRAFT_854613 [Crepidotus variabilis]|uniref:Uncharacterized protein n=1 Tax=Crepidotus variabilis TaxID=179855 RepID=A0A9P6EG84_9AGAR|nr:hypothetical protein CPB83DRAFT_854613 [Crepidotus variabilis]